MKNATVSARVESDIKQEAEAVLQKLGVPASVVINALYRQIIDKQAIPFPLTLHQEPKTLDQMTVEEINVKLQQAYMQSLKQEGRPAVDVFDELEASLK